MNYKRGERVRIKIDSSYRYYLDGLEGTITGVLHHGIVVAIDNPPGALQRLLAPPKTGVGRSDVGPKAPVPKQYVFQMHEIERIPR